MTLPAPGRVPVRYAARGAEIHVRLWDQVRSAHYGLWLRVSERFARTRGPRPETPAGTLERLGFAPPALARAADLARRYEVAFEAGQGAATARASYARLALLDGAFAALGRPLPGRTAHDVGCASFWYAAALHAALRPATLSGFELEGARRLAGGVNRTERALGYLAGLAGTEFVVGDYAEVGRPAGIVTAFFPFVTEAPVLAWRLPLSVLAPARLFARIRANLGVDGELWMVNHGEREAAIAWTFAAGAGLLRRGAHVEREPLLPRPEPAVVSRWTPRAG